MRTCALIGSLVLMFGCNSPEPQGGNHATPARERLGNATAEPAGSELAANPAATEVAASTSVHPCLIQEGEAVTHKLKALGTEPFWAAAIEGRCITYKTPEDQAGTRVWAHVDTGPDGPVWNGALRSSPFRLALKPAAPPGCSDGMSDKTYPMDAILRVDGETRTGCAEPL